MVVAVVGGGGGVGETGLSANHSAAGENWTNGGRAWLRLLLPLAHPSSEGTELRAEKLISQICHFCSFILVSLHFSNLITYSDI